MVSAQQLEQIEQLQANLGKMQLALEVIADAVVWVGDEQQIQWCNSSFERLINQTQNQIIGSRFSEILPLFQSGQPVAIEAYPDVQMYKGNYVTTNYELRQKDNSLLLQISGNCAGLSDKSAVIVIRDITPARQERTHVQQVEQSLQKSEEHLRTLINASPDIICFKDGTGRWLESNQANLEFLGLQGVDYKGKTDIELSEFSSFYRDALLNCIQTDEQAWQKGSLYRVEEFVSRPDGTVSIFDMIKIPLFEQDGRRKGLLTLGRDISDASGQAATRLRKRAEEALRRSEQKYRNIFENSLVGIGRTRLEDGLFLEINQPCAEIIGYSCIADLIGKRYAPEFHVNPSDRSWLLTQIEQYGEVRNFEIQLRHCDGGIRWGLMSARANKEESCLDFMIVDISDRKIAEEARKASEARLNTILDSALAAIYRIRVYAHRDWDFEYCSPKSVQLWGYSPEELLADKTAFVSRIVPEDLAGIYEKAYDDIFAGRTYQGEYRYNHPDGNLRWISLTITSVRDEVADYWIATVISTDISDRKFAEEALRVSEAQYRDLVQTANCIILRWDGNGNVRFLNDYGQRFFGFDLDEIIGRNVIETIVPEIDSSGRNLHALIDDICLHPENYLLHEHENIRKNGERVWIVWANKPIVDEHGNIIEILSVGTDATERKQAREELETSLSLLQATFESIQDGILAIDQAGNIISYNQKFLEIWSIPSEIILEPELDKRLLYLANQVKDSNVFLQKVKALYATPEAYINDLLELKDGRVFERYSCPQKLGENILGRVWTFRDITSRKQAEEALKASEARLNTILNSALAAISRFRVYANREWHFEYCSAGSIEMWGYAPEELIADKHPFVSRIVPEDLEVIYRKVFDEIFAERTSEGEYRYLHPDGNLRWISFKLTSVRDEAADCWIATFMSTDISDRKQREVALSLIVEGTAAKTGDEFFSSCVRYLAQILQVHHAIVTECIDETKTRARTLAVWLDKQSQENFEYEICGTPCAQVLQGNLCYYPQGVQALFPSDADLVTVGAESYLGVPLINASGKILGHLAVIDNKPMVDDPGRELILRIFAARAGAELERKRAEQALQKSELKFRTMVENASDIISLMTLEGKITYVSPNMTGIMGYSVAELEEKSFAPFIHPDDVTISFSTLQKIVELGGNQSTEVRARHKNGSWRWLGSNVSKVVTPSGDALIITCARDITERKIAEAALERRAQAESLLSSISRYFIDQDLDTAINFTLGAIAQFIGADRCCIFEYSQDRSHVHLSHEWCGADIEPLNSMATEGAVTMFPRLAEIAHGKVCQISCVAELPPDAPERMMFESQSIQSMVGVPMIHSDQVVGFVGADVIHNCKIWSQQEINFLKLVGELIAIGRARHQAEEALRVAKEAAEAANRAKSAFLANMSHELRTPLNAILGFAQLMERDPALNSKQRESLATINRSGEHLLNLIDDVLEMSKIEAGRIVFNPESFDLFGLLRTLQEMFQIRAQAKQLFLKFEIAPDLPRYIHTDEGKLRQVLINLLGNAVKFTQTGGVTLRATIGTREKQGSTEKSVDASAASRRVRRLPPKALLLRRRLGTSEGAEEQRGNAQSPIPDPQSLFFEVEDTGCGIAPEEIKNLFKPFTQTSSGIQIREGTGLGLTISRQFIRLMGGEIRAHSKLGQGSTFSFDIHVQTTQPSPTATQLTNDRILELAPEQPHYRILVVDDHQENREPILQLLNSVGFEVEAAGNGQEAVQKWQTWQPQLVFMDMRMPVMDGYEATREIRDRERRSGGEGEGERGREFPASCARTVIIALTASAFEEQKATILAAGCDDLIRKPFREQVLFEKIAQHLGVRYLYAQQQPEVKPAQENYPQASLSIQFSQLSTIMSAQWLAQLRQAALEVDGDRIEQLVEQIPETHSVLAEGITDLVRRFCFDEILEMTEKWQK
ncbi:PAS domain S-box protein [Chlorogloeopsis fritschii]|uniref:PAS domain S-box protein n=1 Tax=Chlorogloeopsis fritschii TaxID=1124 RepID=UPI000369E8A2